MNLTSVNKNNTTATVLSIFAYRSRFSYNTDIAALRSFLVRNGHKIETSDYYQLFKDLEEQGVGEIDRYENNTPASFSWYYSLIKVGKKALNLKEDNGSETLLDSLLKGETVMKSEKKRGRGRPKGSKNKPKNLQLVTSPVENREEIMGKPGLTREVVILFTTQKGKIIPISLKDAENLAKQVQQVKNDYIA